MGGTARVDGDNYARRWLIWPTMMLVGIGALVAALVFAWPQDVSAPSHFDVGPVDSFSIGSVTTVEEGAFHLVRLSEKVFVALSWRDSHSGCTVPWKAGFVWPDPATGRDKRSWFRDPCHGSTYDITGKRVFGPALRDLDRYPVSIVGDRVFVNTDRFVCGHAPPGAPCVSPSPTP